MDTTLINTLMLFSAINNFMLYLQQIIRQFSFQIIHRHISKNASVVDE